MQKVSKTMFATVKTYYYSFCLINGSLNARTHCRTSKFLIGNMTFRVSRNKVKSQPAMLKLNFYPTLLLFVCFNLRLTTVS